MFKNSRKKVLTNRIRPLNQPDKVQVRELFDQKPSIVFLNGKWHTVCSIEDMWEVEDEWWRDAPINRRYYQVGFDIGLTITIFRDMISGFWYEQRV